MSIAVFAAGLFIGSTIGVVIMALLAAHGQREKPEVAA